MRKTREILRLKWEVGRSHRKVAACLGVGLGTVSQALERAREAGLGWEAIAALSEPELDQRLYRRAPLIVGKRPPPDFVSIHTELRRAGVTLQLLHHEYLELHPEGYRYSQYCDLYRHWAKRQQLSMRQVHRAGEKLFVDYSGKKPRLVDPRTGESIEVELFVAVLGASNFTYAEATYTQGSSDFIASHVRALDYLGGVCALIVPDPLRSGVSHPCRYEPGLQRTYEEMARHYDTAILPARPGKARDKAKVEVGVQVAQRWILARLRNETFHTMGALNARIGELREELNDRRMRTYGASRRELFERLDRPALRPLPPERFVYAEWKRARVNIDYHVEVDHHFYSVPFALRQDEAAVEVRLTASTVEMFVRSERVASHLRSYHRGGFTTRPEHMPSAHRKHLEWSPSRILHWGETIGPATTELVRAILTERRHPEQGYRSCLGILRLAKVYGKDRLEAACARGVALRARSYRHIESMLKSGLDRVPLADRATPPAPTVPHQNIRGSRYYQ